MQHFGKVVTALAFLGMTYPLTQCKQRAGDSDLASAKSGGRERAATADKDTVTIVGLNDLHGNIRSKEYIIENGAERPRTEIGGVDALQAYFDIVREYNSRTLFLDAGDIYQGTFFSNFFQGLSVVDAYRHLKIDLTTFGNHEFDYGAADLEPGNPNPDKSADKLGSTKKMVEAATAKCIKGDCRAPILPYLSANVTVGTGAPLHPSVKKSIVLVRDGIRIGIIGATSTATPTQTTAANVVGVKFAKFLDVVPKEAERLRKEEKVQLVVLVTHAGGDCDMSIGQEARGQFIPAASVAQALVGGVPDGDAACLPNVAGKAADDEIMELIRQLPLAGSDGKPNLLGTVDLVMAGHRHSSQSHFITNRDPSTGKSPLDSFMAVPVMQTTGFGKSFSMVDIKLNRQASPLAPAAERIVGYNLHAQTYLCHEHFANFPNCNPELGVVNGFKKFKYPQALGDPVEPRFLGRAVPIKPPLSKRIAAVVATLKPYLDEIIKKSGAVDRVIVDNLPKPLPQNRNVESKMSNCFVDAILAQFNAEFPDQAADLMAVNSSSVRDQLSDGRVTFESIYAVEPFGAKIGRMELTLEELEGLGQSLSVNLPSAIGTYSQGWKVKWNPAKVPRHQSFVIPDALAGKDRFVVITNNFGADAGGPHDKVLTKARAEGRIKVPFLDASGIGVSLLSLFEKGLKSETRPASCEGAAPDRTIVVND